MDTKKKVRVSIDITIVYYYTTLLRHNKDTKNNIAQSVGITVLQKKDTKTQSKT